MTYKPILEGIILRQGLNATLSTLSDICKARCAEIREQDPDSLEAPHWNRASANLDKQANTAAYCGI